MIVNLDRQRLAELFEETYDPNLLYEDSDDDDDDIGGHHNHHPPDLDAPM